MMTSGLASCVHLGSRFPDTVLPITRPAAISTRFLITLQASEPDEDDGEGKPEQSDSVGCHELDHAPVELLPCVSQPPHGIDVRTDARRSRTFSRISAKPLSLEGWCCWRQTSRESPSASARAHPAPPR